MLGRKEGHMDENELDKMIEAVGLERVVTYRRKKKEATNEQAR